MKQQPGVMLYFDVRESIAQLSYEEKGMLLDAILDYGQHGREPEFAGGGLCFIWPFVRRDIHRDSERYEAVRAQRKAAADKRWQKECEPMREDASACKPMQNMPTTTASPSSSPAAAAAPTAAAASESSSTAAPPLPRTNGSALPDLVARYLPGQRSTPEEVDRRRADAIARLRAMPGS